MKTKLPLFSSGLVFVFSLCVASAQGPSRPNDYAESRGKTWLTNYYGKTLSSLGEIVSIRIDRRPSPTSTLGTNWTHRDLWEIIEHSKMQDYHSSGVALGIPPSFSIDYADGLRVRADRYSASITLPDGREGPVVLSPASPSGGSEATASGCEQLYFAWHQECERIRDSSNTYEYVGLPSYRKLVAIGKSALPFLERKMVEDKGLDFMLAFAVVEICGWDRQEFRGGSEQNFRDKVLKKLRETK